MDREKSNTGPTGDWISVTNWRRKSSHDPREKTTFLFTNFSPSWNQEIMWRIFRKYGEVAEAKLNTICIGTQKLMCDLARFQRGQPLSFNKNHQNSSLKINPYPLPIKPIQPIQPLSNPPKLYNPIPIPLSLVCPQSCQNIFTRTPNLRKLGFCGPLISTQGDIEFPNICSLQYLHKLKLFNTISYPKPTRLLNTMMFPAKLKKLNLLNTGMDWKDMWAISLLPNLEVLKLKFHACNGEKWETSNVMFQNRRILKLNCLSLNQWVCSRDNFSRLQRLVVHHCLKLNSIPLDQGKILTLEVIEAQWCSKSTQV